MRKMENLVGGLVFALFLIIVVAGVLGIVLFWPRYPEDIAFLLGFLSFWILSNRLLFGYSQFINLSELLLSGVEPDRGYVIERIGQPAPLLEALALPLLMIAWLRELDKYKYTYYTAFLLITLLAILFKFNLLGYGIAGNYIEGTFWGAAVITFIVFSLELIAHTYVEEILNVSAVKSEEVKDG